MAENLLVRFDRESAVGRNRTMESVRSYYRTVLPFYDRECANRGDLEFWREICRERSPEAVLELGCGTGRVTRVLSAPSVVAIDLLPELLSLAKRSLAETPGKPALVTADVCRFAFRNRFDLILAADDPLSHLTRLQDRRACLRCVARHLSDRGTLVLEGLYRPERRSVEIAERALDPGGTLFVRESWRPIGREDLWLARYLYRETAPAAREVVAEFTARAWDPAAVASLLRSCGLFLEEMWGDFARGRFEPGSSRMILVASARKH